jgi:beta-lactamase class A
LAEEYTQGMSGYRPLLFGLSLLCLVAGAFGAVWVSDYLEESCSARYTHLNDSVVCDDPDVILKTEYGILRQGITFYIEQAKAQRTLADAAVYFRDLEHGPVFGVNETTDFAPASLLKLPLAITYLGIAENQPDILDKELWFEGELAAGVQNFPPAQTIEPGRHYSVRDLLFKMLAYSDNRSYSLLARYLDEAVPNGNALTYKTYQELGFTIQQNADDQFVSVRGYASLFRILYNVSYLNAPLNELLLSWLEQSSFTQGVRAGVPQGVMVAHKFGELSAPDGTKQLQDCGIVYYPGNPYVLCVMARGDNWDELQASIQTLSRMVYEEVDSRKL